VDPVVEVPQSARLERRTPVKGGVLTGLPDRDPPTCRLGKWHPVAGDRLKADRQPPPHLLLVANQVSICSKGTSLCTGDHAVLLRGEVLYGEANRLVAHASQGCSAWSLSR
jgi:hypothetical protein